MATEIGIIKALVGTATATATDGTIRNLQVGDKVYQNDLITTGAAGAVEIEFADGSTMDMGRSSQAMLDLEVFDPSAAATETAETTETTDDIAAIQQALLEGEDPTVAGEATAAGAGAGDGSEGGHDFVVREYLNPEVTPDNGFDTTGPGVLFLQSEEELNELDDVPTAGTTTVTLDEDDLVSGQTLDLGAAGDEFLAFLNGDFGISAFSIGNPVDGLFNSPSNGVGDERTELGDDPADGQFLSGSLIAEYGFNGPSPTTPIIFNVISGSDVTDSEGNPVTSGGQQVKYWVSADGLTVIGYIAGEYGPQLPPQINDELAVKQQVFDGCEGPGNDYPEMAQIVFTAQLTPTAEGGNFLVGIFAQFDHQAPDYENGEFVFENNMFLNLGFTISDADGDTATGTLQINVDDDSPVRAGDEESLATQTGVAYEDGLSLEDGDLSEGNPNSAVAMAITSDASDAEQSDIESFLGLSAGALEPAVDSNGGDGNATNGSAAKTALTVETGDIISFNWSFDNNDGGSFNDFAFVVINGEVFELADSNGGNLASNPFTYEVTADGEITIGFGQMNVGDQISDSSLSVSDLTLNGNPVNGGFDGALTGWDTLGNVSDSDSLFNSDVTTGNLNSVVNMGADGPGSFALLQPSENEFEQALFQAAMDSLPTLSSKGEAVSYSINEYGELVATAGEGEDAREVFTLTVNEDGTWTFDLNDQLDHVGGETAEENFSLITLDENGEPNGSVDSIDFTQLLQIRDFDGDQLIITEDDAGMFSIAIKDDIPVATGETVSATVDEDDIRTDLSTGNNPYDNDGDGSYTGEPITIFGYTTDFFNIGSGGPATTTGSVASLVSFGADEEGTFNLGDNFAGLEAQALTSKGDELSFEVQGDTLIASADGRAVFTLELEDNGEFTFTLYDQLDHAAGEGENNLPLDLSTVIQATDKDNDTITLDSGFIIDVTDDVPEQAGLVPDIGIVEEEALPAGNQEENDGSFFGFPIDGYPDTAVATGSLQDQVSVGADESVTFGFATDLPGLPELTSNGLSVNYEVNGDTLTASTDSGDVFTLQLESNGSYTFTLKSAIDHAPGQGENIQVIDFSSVVEATDFDGDTLTLDNDFYIKVVDDIPVATDETVSVTVDEDDIRTDLSTGNDPYDNDGDGSYTGEPITIFGYTTDFFNIGSGGPATTTGSVAALVSFGADENGTFSLGSNFTTLEGLGLTSQGDELSFEVNGDTLVASADGRAVFTLELDDNGDFTFSLYDQLDHATGNGENNLSLDLSSVIQATDSDNDTVTLDSGFTINVTDDVPEQDGLSPDIGIVEEEALPNGNQEQNDLTQTINLGIFGTYTIPIDGWPDTAVATGSLADQVNFGADEPGSFYFSENFDSLVAQNLTSNDEPLSFGVDGDTLYAVAGQTAIFSLKLESNGEYTFTLMGPLDHPDSELVENLLSIDFSDIVIAEDFDGDTLTLNQDFFIKIVDDSPVVTPYDVNTMRIISDDETVAGLNGNVGEGFGTSDGTGTDSKEFNQSKTLQFSAGADGGTVAWNLDNTSVDDGTAGISFSVDANGTLILTQEQNGEPVQIATVTLDETTGDYVYTQTANVLHTPGNAENEASFTLGFTVTDGDGDTADGKLTLLIDDDSPTITPYDVNTMRIISDDDSVAGLDGNPGGVGDSNQFNLNGTLQFSAGADGGTVAWNLDNTSVDDATADISFSVDADGTLIITQEQGGVPVQIATVTLDETTGDYIYTQTDNLLHTPGNDENNADFTLGFTVTDGDGDTAEGNLTLRIDDDTPVITAQSIQILSESFENFADINGDNFTVAYGEDGQIIGNNGIVWNVNAAGIEIQSGNVGDSEASDGNVHAELDTDNNDTLLAVLSTEIDLPTSDATLSFDYKPRPDNEDDSDMQVSLGDKVVTINSDAAGNITFGVLPEGVTANQETNPATGWTTITLSYSGLSTETPQTLAFEGLGNANEFGAYLDNINVNATVALTVDESALADGNGEVGATTSASYDFSGFFTAAFGADGPADEASESYSLNLNGEDIASGLFAVDNTDTDAGDGDGYGQGAEIVLNQVGDQIVGSAGGVDYFTISVNAETGQVTLTQLNNVWHADTTNPDDSQGMVLDAGVLSLVKAITDADEDNAEAALDLSGVNFNFEDDAPTIAAEQPVQPYLLTITNEGGDAGYNNTYGYYIKGENGEPVSGEIIWANVKDNESAEITIEVTDPSDIGFFIIPDGADLNELNNGDAVTFEQDGEGNWQVVLDGTPLSGQDTNVLFDNSDLNPDNADALQDNAAVGNQNWEDIIGGDNDFNDVNINVSINQLGAITVDETDIGNGDPSNATASLNLAGSFAAAFGADGPGKVDYSLTANTEVETGLVDTLSDKAVQLRETADGVEGYITSDDDQDFVVFTVTVDENGEVTLTQLRAVEHDDVTDPDEANSPAILNAGAIALVATAADADGDTASDSIDLGVLMAFEDDGPSVGEQAANSVDEGNTTTGTLVFDAGQDGGGISHIDGTGLEFGQDGFSQEIELDHGTIKVKANGEYSYTVDSGSVEQDEVENFNFTVTDGDGDTAQGAVAITIVNAQVADVITLNDVTVSEGDGTATITGSVENPVTGTPLVITLDNGATITIPVGDISAESTPFAVQGDDVYLDGESYIVEVTGTTGGNYSSLDTSDDATVTVNDTNDTVTATLTASPAELSEDGGDITYTITLTGGPGAIDPDSDLVFNLDNGEQVTVQAGDVTGSYTRTYTDGEVTNQASISNSIVGIASGGSEYEDLQTAGTTTVDVDYAPEITDLTPKVDGGDVTVDEDDLAGGSDGSDSTTVAGSFTISAPDGIESLSVGGEAVISGGTYIENVTFETPEGNTLTFTDYNETTGELSYEYTLNDNTLEHGPANNGENSFFEDFEVVLTDTDNDEATDTLSVQIVDDVPDANPDTVATDEGASETRGSDLVLMIDTSASVSSSDLNSLKTSLQNMFNSGSVNSVFITAFAEGGTFIDSGVNGGWFTNLGDAMDAINGLSSSGSGTLGTDYDAALQAVTSNFTAPPPGGGQLVSMFISDGEPNESNGTGSNGITSSEEAAWIQFLENNGFDNSYAVGYNGLNSGDIDELEPIAWTPGEANNTYSDSDDENVIILDDIDDLTDTLESTVTATPEPVTGNVLDNDTSGADGYGAPALVDVTYDGDTVTFTDTTTSATFVTDAGTVVINSDGSYEFTGLADTDADISATIDYTIQDADGDQSSTSLTVTTQNVVENELYVGNNTANSKVTDAGNDVLIGDLGGREQQFNPGSNYSIALIADESGSMAGDRLTLLKDALESFVNDLAEHDGVINIALIGFGPGASLEISVSDLANNPDGLDDLLAEIDDLAASGGTNYEAAFDEAVEWFDGQPDGHEFISYFMTDGDPTLYNGGGDGNETDFETFQAAVEAFAALSDISEVNAIGIGSGVNGDYLRFFDNTNNNGMGTEVFGETISRISNFQGSADPLDTASDWTVSGDTRESFNINGVMEIEDRRGNGATVVTSAVFLVAVDGSVLQFDYETSSLNSSDELTWSLQRQEGSSWVEVSGGDLDEDTNGGSVESSLLQSGQYRLVYTVEDSGTGNASETLEIDNIELRVPEQVTGLVGQPQIINNAGELVAELQGGNTTDTPADLGDDVLEGGDGNDVIFGDTIFTDDLTWTNGDTNEEFTAGHGLGYEGLVEYLTWAVNSGDAPDDAQIMQYIRDHYDDLINPNPTQAEIDAAGNDTLIGGAGNDFLIGGAGADIFQWNEGDDGSEASPADDTVVDFNAGEGDVLDISDLLQGEEAGTITDYIKVAEDGDDVVISLSPEGTEVTQEIRLEGNSLESLGVTGNPNLGNPSGQLDAINQLINNGQINVDQS